MTHDDHCYVTNRSNLLFAVNFLNALTETHADSATKQHGKLKV